MTQRVAVRAAVEADHAGIAALLDETFGPRPRAMRERLWAWRQEANAAFSDGMPGFLVADQAGAIVGVQGLLPLRFKVGADTIIAACSCDLAAAPSARGAGLQIKHAAMNSALSALPLTTSANETANRLSRALGAKALDPARVKYIKPLRPAALVAARVRRSRPRLGALLGATAFAVDAAAGSAMTLRDWMTHPRGRAGERIEEVTRFDARFDALWSRVAGRYPVLIVRDASYLEWRYARYPFAGVESFALTTNGEPRGFAVIHIAPDEEGLSAASLLELFGEETALEALLTEAIRRSVRADASYIAAKSSSVETRRLLERRGFLARASEHSPYTYKVNRPELADVLEKDDNWYISLGDGDIAFTFGAERR